VTVTLCVVSSKSTAVVRCLSISCHSWRSM